jgi:hypothetical protein
MKASVSLIAAFLIGWQAPQASGTTVPFQTWEQLFENADFVGVVEFVEAGGIVAGYKVVESWKGQAEGTKMLVAIPPDAHGDRFPTVLTGDKHLIMASRAAQIRLSSFSFAPDFPLWWRRVQPDYTLPLFQGQWALNGSPDEAYGLASSFGRNVRTLDQVRTKVMEYQFFNDQELLTLRDRALQTLDDYVTSDGAESPDSKQLRQEVVSAKTVEQILTALFDMPLEGKSEKHRLKNILSYGGREKTLAAVEAMLPQNSPLGAELHKATTESLRRHLRDSKATIAPRKSPDTPQPEPLVSAERIEEARKTFQANEWGPKRSEVFDILVKHDPALVAEALLSWTSLNKWGEVTELGYEAGSAFCFQCGKNRAENFTKLLTAKDPYVRVAAAVYLCFEDKQAGLRELQKLSEVPGIAGDWAATVMIERGDKQAMQRALTMLDPVLHKDDNPYVYSALFRATRNRLLVVLSNTAFHHQLGLPKMRVAQKEEDAATFEAAYHQEMLGWWQRNRDKVELQNPWAAVLKPQKVD